MTLRAPASTLFPYTTLFRSVPVHPVRQVCRVDVQGARCAVVVAHFQVAAVAVVSAACDLLALVCGTASAVEVPAVCFRVDRKSTRLNSSHVRISYAVFCLKK